MRRRVVFGLSLTGVIVLLLAVDVWLARGGRPEESDALAVLSYWLRHGLVVTLLLTTLAVLLTHELIDIAHRQEYRPLRFETFFFAVGLVIGPYVSFNLRESAALYDEAYGMVWLSLALGYTFWAQAVRRGTAHVLRNIATTMFIIFYAGGLIGYLVKLRMEVGGYQGTVLLLLSMLVVKMTDTGAYFVGSLVGRTKFLPWLSPKKTWEGIAGGVATALAVSIGAGALIAANGWCRAYDGALGNPLVMGLFGLGMALLSIGGDLAGSLLKRDAALKDSSKLIPGLGGVLDVMDSPLITAPLAWWFWTRAAPLIQ